MDIQSEKISELLKNPEIVGMIASLASGFSSKSTTESNASETTDVVNQEENVPAPDGKEALPVSQTLTDIPALSFPKSNAYSDRRIALLQAIKPYVNDSKKDRVDSLVKAIGVAGVLNSYGTGIFDGLFGSKK